MTNGSNLTEIENLIMWMEENNMDAPAMAKKIKVAKQSVYFQTKKEKGELPPSFRDKLEKAGIDIRPNSEMYITEQKPQVDFTDKLIAEKDAHIEALKEINREYKRQIEQLQKQYSTQLERIDRKVDTTNTHLVKIDKYLVEQVKAAARR